MGTRNVTIIKFNGEEKVRQYGQWDGYPTSALVSIVEFLKTDGAIEHLKRNVVKCQFAAEDVNTFPAKAQEIANANYKIGYIADTRQKMEKLAEHLSLHMDVIFKYILATRDTGYEIPNVLIMPEADTASEIILCKAYTNECDWQIEAVNIIDLDAELIISYWHGDKMMWDFNCLPNEEEIESYEKRFWES